MSLARYKPSKMQKEALIDGIMNRFSEFVISKNEASFEPSFFYDSSTNESSKFVLNQMHGKIFEKRVALLKYGVDVEKYSYISKYDIEAIDNKKSQKNVSIKATSGNLVCCGDVFRFLQSENCEMTIVVWKQDGQVKRAESMYTLCIEDLIANYDTDKLRMLYEFRLYIQERKEYFQTIGITDEFLVFRNYCKEKSKDLSDELIRINTKISTPKLTKDGKFRCENFRIQCSINMKKLKKQNVCVKDISHELFLYNIPITIQSLPRNNKKC